MTGNADGLFEFIAECVHQTVPEEQGDLGFTFSFPMDQTSINEAQLIRWTKGFSTSGVPGQDVCKLLQKAFDKKGVRLRIVAVCNDTVGTLVTQYFQDSKASIGVIIGTGFNCAYWEQIRDVTKLVDSKQAAAGEQMCINMECGNFDSYKQPRALPFTKYDAIIDQRSPNPGFQYTEKLISGMYLGAVCQEIFVDLIQKGVLCNLPGLVKKKFQTWQLSLCLADTSDDLLLISKHLQETYGVCGSEQDRSTIRWVCYLVANRSARIATAVISTIAAKIGVSKDCTVAVDGSVFEKVPDYKQMMELAFQELQLEGDPFHYFRFKLTKEGSGVGAGLIAALASQNL